MGIRFSKTKPKPQQCNSDFSLVDALREIKEPFVGTEACAEIDIHRLDRIIPLAPNNPPKKV
jgi:hypothetical protein